VSDHTAWMPIDIRAAAPDDLEPIAAVDAAAWREHYAPHVPPEVAEAWLVRIPYAWRRSFREGGADFVVLFADARELCGPGLFVHVLAANRRANAFWQAQGLRVIAEMKDVLLDAEIPTLIYAY
jgi:hypothetical protein